MLVHNAPTSSAWNINNCNGEWTLGKMFCFKLLTLKDTVVLWKLLTFWNVNNGHNGRYISRAKTKMPREPVNYIYYIVTVFYLLACFRILQITAYILPHLVVLGFLCNRKFIPIVCSQTDWCCCISVLRLCLLLPKMWVLYFASPEHSPGSANLPF